MGRKQKQVVVTQHLPPQPGRKQEAGSIRLESDRKAGLEGQVVIKAEVIPAAAHGVSSGHCEAAQDKLQKLRTVPQP